MIKIFTVFFGLTLITVGTVLARKTLYSNKIRCPNCRNVFRTDADKVFIDYRSSDDEESLVAICRNCSEKKDLNPENIYIFFKREGCVSGSDSLDIIKSIRDYFKKSNNK